MPDTYPGKLRLYISLKTNALQGFVRNFFAPPPRQLRVLFANADEAKPVGMLTSEASSAFANSLQRICEEEATVPKLRVKEG